MTLLAGSDRARRAAVRLLRWYPRPWRARYQNEMQALLEDIPVGWAHVANLAGAAIREWLSLRALGWPARSAAGRVRMARALTFGAFAYALDGVSRVIAARLLAAGVVLTPDMQNEFALLLFVPLTRVTIAGACRLKIVQRSRFGDFVNRHSWIKYTSDLEILVWTAMYLPSLVLHHALPIPDYLTGMMRTISPYMDFYLVWIWTNLLVSASRRTARLSKIELSSLRRGL